MTAGANAELQPADNSYLGFVGVTTGGSSVRQVFPLWAAELGLPTRTLRGYDIAPGSPPQAYRDVVSEIRRDPQHLGALVTTHKMAVFSSARDLFDDLDELALVFGEISSISKRGGRLRGAAKDPVTVALALDEFLPANHFTSTGGAALVLGSGGAGCALTYHLGLRGDRPTKIICTSRDQSSLDHHRQLHKRADIPGGLVDYALTSQPEGVDELLASLPPASLVVNATGMGKDLPGSPMTDAGRFPDHGVVWEFNYRGTLEFLSQAHAQQDARSLAIEDGWRYFIHGWTQVLSDVFDIPMARATVDRLREIAAGVR